jgi:hypothetical protein
MNKAVTKNTLDKWLGLPQIPRPVRKAYVPRGPYSIIYYLEGDLGVPIPFE